MYLFILYVYLVTILLLLGVLLSQENAVQFAFIFYIHSLQRYAQLNGLIDKLYRAVI